MPALRSCLVPKNKSETSPMPELLDEGLGSEAEMRDSEAITAKSLQDEGWTVYRGGWPDFLCIRHTEENLEVIGVEVKTYGDVVRSNQCRMHKALESIGISVRVIYQGEKPVCTRRRKKFIREVFYRPKDEAQFSAMLRDLGLDESWTDKPQQ